MCQTFLEVTSSIETRPQERCAGAEVLLVGSARAGLSTVWQDAVWQDAGSESASTALPSQAGLLCMYTCKVRAALQQALHIAVACYLEPSCT